MTPGSVPGLRNGSVMLDPSMPAYYTVDDSQLVTGVAQAGDHVQIDRELGSKVLRVFGGIG